MSNPATRIGIAVVEYRGRYLVGIRPAGKPLAGYAEFPGGKCLPEESPAQCACRECFEETGLRVRTVDLLMHREFEYEHGMLDLHFWLCRPMEAEEVADLHQEFRWVPAAKLSSLQFPEANQPLIEVLGQA
jgi:mutator protein MutT